jgi:uncharacterized protein YndB with AHSA1/START domain
MNTALEADAAAPATVVVRRTIAASPAELFDAWLDPQALAIWMRPSGIRRTTATADARVGGRYEIIMQGDQTTHPHHGIYQLIDRPRRLVFTWISNATAGRETLVTVDFHPRGESTEVVITHERLPEGASESHTEGWTSALARLADRGSSESLS